MRQFIWLFMLPLCCSAQHRDRFNSRDEGSLDLTDTKDFVYPEERRSLMKPSVGRSPNRPPRDGPPPDGPPRDGPPRDGPPQDGPPPDGPPPDGPPPPSPSPIRLYQQKQRMSATVSRFIHEILNIEHQLITYRDKLLKAGNFNRRNYPRPPRPGDPFPPPPDGKWKRQSSNSKRLCERKYSEYVQRIFPGDSDTVADANDSEFDGRVLARPGEYPHMAAVGFESEDDDGKMQIDYKCGGSLISESFVLTAAHCTSLNGKTPTKVRIGDLNLMVDEGNVDPQTRSILNIYNQPNYDKELYYNDIALLEMDENIEFTEFVRPIRLWIYPQLPTSIAFAMGYGATAFAKAITYRLTDMNLTIVPNTECNSELPVLDETPNGVVESQICAHDYIMNRDTCQGDSGGPLQLNLPGKRNRQRIHYHLIGITSYGVFCRSAYPSVYTRVSMFLDWIESVVWSN